jgi:hypothetical protein
VDVSHLAHPSAFDPATRAKLVRAALDGDGTFVRGDAAAVTGFADVWRTAFVRLRGVPDEVVGTVREIAAFVAALHAVLASKYRELDVPMPSWRSWPGLRKRWPFLPPPLPPPPPPATTPYWAGMPAPAPWLPGPWPPRPPVARPPGLRRVLVVRPA